MMPQNLDALVSMLSGGAPSNGKNALGAVRDQDVAAWAEALAAFDSANIGPDGSPKLPTNGDNSGSRTLASLSKLLEELKSTDRSGLPFSEGSGLASGGRHAEALTEVLAMLKSTDRSGLPFSE
ncbi:MAG TPA: hypothetical protein VKO38_06260, partial [Wenzhouxiangella sp.]|nr:hypothetical protein [Wenzhouxiangella sp.]